MKNDCAGLAEYVERETAKWDFSGVIRVVRNGAVAYEMSRGFANLEFGVENTMQTRFTVGSVTKQFTAFAVLLLYDRGLLSPEEQANCYLPADMQISPGITVHHLLSHTSGLYNFYNFEDDFFVGEDRALYRKQEYFRKWILKAPAKPAGLKFDYNNSNYNLLAWIIEAVSGQPYAEFIRQNIFEPLGMEQSAFDDGQSILRNKAVNYMRDYDTVVQAPYTNQLFHIGAGCLVTSCGDLQRWYECLRDRKILSGGAYERFFRENRNQYCYGLERHLQNDSVKYSHSGDYLGVSSYTQYFFAEDLCIIILSNTGTLNQYRFGNTIADILCGKAAPSPAFRTEYPLSPDELQAFSGTYLPGKIHLLLKDGKLYLTRVNWNIHIELYFVSPCAFMRRYEEQSEPRCLLQEGAAKPSLWGYELLSHDYS